MARKRGRKRTPYLPAMPGILMYGQDQPPIRWLINDNFTTALTAGNVDSTAAEPGPGTRTAGSSLALSGGNADLSASANDSLSLSPAITRSPGIAAIFAPTITDVTQTMEFGFDTNQAGPIAGSALRITGDTLKPYSSGGAGPTIYAPADSTSYRLVNLLRATGQIPIIWDGTSWLNLGSGGANTTATLYVGWNNTTALGTIDYLRVANLYWLPVPLTSDGFGTAGALATSDGLGHAEGVAGGIGSGGDGKTWTAQVGTWTNTAGKLAAATLSGGIAVATTTHSTDDVIISAGVVGVGGEVGVVARWADANNYLYAAHDGTNCYLKQVLAGSTTTLLTAAATYSAGAELRLIVEGVNGYLYYNNALVGTVSTINAGLTGTAHGVRSTNTGNTLDDFTVYSRYITGQGARLLDRMAAG